MSVDSVPRRKHTQNSCSAGLVWEGGVLMMGGEGEEIREEANADARREWPAPLGHCRERHDSEKGRSTLWRNNFPADPIKYRYLGGRKCYPHILLHNKQFFRFVIECQLFPCLRETDLFRSGWTVLYSTATSTQFRHSLLEPLDLIWIDHHSS